MWCAGDHYYFDKNQIDDLPKWIDSATGKRIRILPAGWEALIECAQNSRSHEDGGRPGFASVETLRKRRSANTFRKWRLVWEAEGLLDVQRRPGTGDQPLTNACYTRNGSEHTRKIWSLFPCKPKRNFGEKSCRVICSSMGSQSNTKTDPEPEIHETEQQPPDKPQLVDNVYSGNPAETPTKPAIPEPGVPQVQAFRQTLANWFGVAVSFQTTLWLLCFMQLRRWNVRAFFRDVERNHKPKLFHSQDAAWRYMAADYLKRGPVLESYPPEKPPPHALAASSGDQHSAVSDQQQTPANPIIAQRRELRPAQSESPPGVEPEVSEERARELCDARGIDYDAFLRWLFIQERKPHPWPTSERRTLNWITKYLNRNG